MQQANGTFNEAGLTAGVASVERSRGAAVADFDLDGRLDILVSNRRAPMEIYRNETQNTGHWIGVKLIQGGGNINAIGARVTVGRDIQQVYIGGGHAGGQALPLHFGLGSSAEVSITVEWPDGVVQVYNTKADQTVVLRH